MSGIDFTKADAFLKAVEDTIDHPVTKDVKLPLKVGVDLGTAYTVLVVLDSEDKPVACAMEFANVIRDGLVVDYLGAQRIVKRLKDQIEQKIGMPLTTAAIAVPPGTGERDSQTHRYVVQGAGMEVVDILDEPTAANNVLGIKNGCVVDIGGGTTGLSVLQDGEVIYTADEPTGGTHITLVLSGHMHMPIEDAELYKRETKNHTLVLGIVKPVISKMASIISRHLQGYHVDCLYLVGGTCCLTGMEQIIQNETGILTIKPAMPLLVTPAGIAMACKSEGGTF